MKKFYSTLLCSLCFFCGSFAQTLIDPIQGGGFDLGNTFALNGWTVVNSTANKWVVGSTTFNSPPNSAYISSDGSVANYNYNDATAHISHFYQKVTFPANATNIVLSFQLKGNVEWDYDNFIEQDGLQVYADPSLVPPVADVLPDIGALQIYQFNPSVTYTGQTQNLNGLAGQTVLLIFTWLNNGDGIGSGPPASVDDIKLTYCIANTPYSVTGGGGYCPGTLGANIGLSGSVVGIDYQLYNNGLAVGSPVAGTGSPIDFGPQVVGGPYTVKGFTGSCSYTMLGSKNVTLFPSPTASAGSNTPVCSGSTLNLTASAGSFYSWTGPNNFTSANQNPSIAGVATAASGTYTVNVVDANGCAAPASTDVVVTPANTITLSSAAGTDGQINCINTPVADITYTTTGATGATFTGLPAGVTGSWASNIVTITGTPTTSAGSPFNYTVTLTGGCGNTSISGSITIITGNTITLSSAVGTDTQISCINTPITDITYTTTGATGATFTGLPAGVTGSWASNVVTITGTPTTSAGSPFNYTVTLTGGCGNTSISGSITVITGNTITLSSAPGTDAQISCINTPVADITYTTTGATGATFTGLPAGVTGSWASNIVTITGTPTTSAGSPFNYTVTLTGGCGNTSISGSITIITGNTITLSSAVGTDTQISCINTPITDITYTTTGATGATFTGLPAGVTGSWASNVVTITGTPTTSAGSPFNYTVTLTGGCGNTSISGSITVITGNTITLSSAPGTDAQISCINTPVADITYTTTGATGATFTGLPAGVTGSWASNIVTITGTPTTSAGSPFNYTVTLIGGCGNVAAFGSIMVNDQNTISLTSAVGTNAQTACINASISDITYSTTTATGATFSGLPTGVAGNWASNQVTISGIPLVSGTFNYTVTSTGGCGNTIASGIIMVNAQNTIALSSAVGTDAQTPCINTPITDITYATTTATGATFSGLPPGVSGNWAANQVTISGMPTTSGTYNYIVTLTGGCGNMAAAGSITVKPIAALSLTSAPGTEAQTVCNGSPIISIVYTYNDAAGATVTPVLPAGLTLSLGMGGTLTISGNPSVNGTFNYTVKTTGGCGIAMATGTITVQPANGGSVTSAAICGGGDGSLTLSGQSGTLIDWQYSTDSSSALWTSVGNANNPQSFSGIIAPTFYRAVVTNTCGNVYSSIASVAIHNYWTGASTTDWNTATNWSDGLVPSTTLCSDVYIVLPLSGNLPVVNAVVPSITHLHILGGATVTINGTGTLTIGGSISEVNPGSIIARNGTDKSQWRYCANDTGIHLLQ